MAQSNRRSSHSGYLRKIIPSFVGQQANDTCFYFRLDPAKVGRGICELSSVGTDYFDLGRDFVFDPEFSYYEKVYSQESPNCGYLGHHSSGSPHPNPGKKTSNENLEQTPWHQLQSNYSDIVELDGNGYGREDSVSGGPYYGGDSYGPWSTGYGTVNHGPWGTHGYGSGFYVSNNPSRGPSPSFQPNNPSYSYGNGGRHPYQGK